MELAEQVLAGNRLALARLLTQIENDALLGRQALDALYPYTGRAQTLGVTGAPGTGKSSLVNQLALYYRHADPPRRVGIVAVDPSSPFSGGAILGDRVRMRDLAGDTGVFIRSMASRGALGGLAASTAGVVAALDAAGYEVILIETVGAGQAEVEIARLAQTTLVIEAPGLGDDIQAIKAGIMEIADVLVINKADRPGVEATERALKGMLALAHPAKREWANQVVGHHAHSHNGDNDGAGQIAGEAAETADFWLPPIVRTVATEGIGIEQLGQAIAAHQDYLRRTGELQRRERSRLRGELTLLLRETLMRRWQQALGEEAIQAMVERLLRRELSPWQAVQQLLQADGN